jgi:hypothetical protein
MPMNKLPPIVGVVLLVLCLPAQWAFAHYHVDAGNVVTTALAIAVAIIFGRLQVDNHRELVQLRESMRPGPHKPNGEPDP